MSADVLRCERVSMRFGHKEVLRELDFALAPGEVTVLLGENGSGKSTLLRLALGVLRAAQGRITVLGRDPVRAAQAVQQAVGYVPSEPDVDRWITPRELCAFLRAHYPGFDTGYAMRLAAELRVPLGRRFAQLSRGEAMKAMLVAALAPRPRLLLLDEPFAGLDPLVRDEVLAGVLGPLRDAGMSVLCATHELDVTARLADRIAVLAHGRIVRHGPLEELVGADQGRLPAAIGALLQETCA